MIETNIPPRRVWRPLGRPGRRQAAGEPTVPPPARITAAAGMRRTQVTARRGIRVDASRSANNVMTG